MKRFYFRILGFIAGIFLLLYAQSYLMNFAEAVDTKISAMSSLATPTDSTVIPVVLGGANYKLSWSATKATLQQYFNTVYVGYSYIGEIDTGYLYGTTFNANKYKYDSSYYWDTLYILKWDTSYLWATDYAANKLSFLTTDIDTAYTSLSIFYDSLTQKVDTSYIPFIDSSNYWSTTFAGNKTAYDSAVNWGDHALIGYLTDDIDTAYLSVSVFETAIASKSDTSHNHDTTYSKSKIYYDSVAPETAPLQIGDFWRDTTLSKVYFGFDTTDSTSWLLLN